MPLIIENATTGKFIARNGRWTKSIAKAMSFDQVLRAFDEISERGLSGVRVLLRAEAGEEAHPWQRG
jgi:hypothetical protein